MMKTESDLIDALGGTGAVKALCDVKHNTVSMWRKRGFPPWAMATLRIAADTAGVSYDPALFYIKRHGERHRDRVSAANNKVSCHHLEKQDMITV